MLTITVDDSAFRTYLKQLQKDLGDLYPVMDSIGNALETRVRIGFASEYAAYHEWGTVNMDRRGMLMADPDAGTLGQADEAAVLDIVAGWLDDLAA